MMVMKDDMEEMNSCTVLDVMMNVKVCLILVNEKNWMGTDNKQWHSRDKDR
jgi:hypothetical protein